VKRSCKKKVDYLGGEEHQRLGRIKKSFLHAKKASIAPPGGFKKGEGKGEWGKKQHKGLK